MSTLDRISSSLSPEEWRYVGAGALAFFGLVTWAVGFRTMRSLPRLGDRSCPAFVYEEVLLAHGGKTWVAQNAWKYEPVIVDAAIHFGAPPDLMMAMAHTESRFQPTAVSSAGAVGLVQFMPRTAAKLHKRLVDEGNWPFLELDREDPAQSAWMAAYWMADMLRVRDVEHAVAAYNAGESRVKPDTPKAEWPPQTRSYVPAVLRRRKYYREIWQRCGTIFA